MDKDVRHAEIAISVVVPVYNVDKYLVRCLDSIFSQKFSERFEVIAINDCSTDNSLAILTQYQKKQSSLIIIEHRINKKLSCARKSGINASTGKYIMHVDSDDWLLPGALQNLFNKIEKYDADIVVFNYLRENNAGKKNYIKAIEKELITKDKRQVANLFLGACWNKIVKAELLTNIIYGEIGINSEEDLVYSLEILLKANNICLIPEYYYVYFENIHSITALIKPEVFLKNQHVVLAELNAILNNYNADDWTITYVINYFEKWIYLGMAELHFWQKENLANINNSIRGLFNFPIMTEDRINKLELSMNNKYASLYTVAKYFGVKKALGILVRGFTKNIKIN